MLSPVSAATDVIAIGHALVDVLAHVDDAFLRAQAMAKGAMTLVDGHRATALYDLMPPAMEASGGSAANTAAAVAALGGRAAFAGKVGRDELGRVFEHDIRAAGVDFHGASSPSAPTGRSLIFVTPDAQRTMNTFLGAAAELGPEDVEEPAIAGAQVTYLEGYLFDPPRAKQAFRKAARAARSAGRRVALTLSDPFCVERHREDFIELVANDTDVLFANEAELMSLYRTATLDDAVALVRRACEIAVITRSEKGSVVARGDDAWAIDAVHVGPVVDTTGAGDAYAAGFLHGLTSGRELPVCGRLGSICAGEVISHFGARPLADLRELVRAHGGS